MHMPVSAAVSVLCILPPINASERTFCSVASYWSYSNMLTYVSDMKNFVLYPKTEKISLQVVQTYQIFTTKVLFTCVFQLIQLIYLKKCPHFQKNMLQGRNQRLPYYAGLLCVRKHIHRYYFIRLVNWKRLV